MRVYVCFIHCVRTSMLLYRLLKISAKTCHRQLRLCCKLFVYCFPIDWIFNYIHCPKNRNTNFIFFKLNPLNILVFRKVMSSWSLKFSRNLLVLLKISTYRTIKSSKTIKGLRKFLSPKRYCQNCEITFFVVAFRLYYFIGLSKSLQY